MDGPHDHVFYDANCGLCQRSVRFLASLDPQAKLFRFAPLGSDLHRQLAPGSDRGTVVVVTADGAKLVRSTAMLHLLTRTSTVWRFVGRMLLSVPAPLRDLVYRGVAYGRRWMRIRKYCPVLDRKHMAD